MGSLLQENDDDEYCQCAETLLSFGRVKKPRWHNCEYIQRVNSKILENAMLADKLSENIQNTIYKKREWQRVFARHMDHARFSIMHEMEEEAKQEPELESK